MTPSSQNITKLLLDWRDGDGGALDRLMPLVYEELRRIANHTRNYQKRGGAQIEHGEGLADAGITPGCRR